MDDAGLNENIDEYSQQVEAELPKEYRFQNDEAHLYPRCAILRTCLIWNLVGNCLTYCSNTTLPAVELTLIQSLLVCLFCISFDCRNPRPCCIGFQYMQSCPTMAPATQTWSRYNRCYFPG